MNWRSIGVMIACIGMVGIGSALAGEVDPYELVWTTPGAGSFDSMPLGNGDIGLNVWVEGNGDVVFYISKVDAYDASHLLPKLGRVRVRMTPALPVDRLRQRLALREGAIFIEAGDVNLSIWVDANNPVIRVDATSGAPREATIELETLRKLTNVASAPDAKLPPSGTAGVLLDDHADRLAWCYRNMSSAWADHLRSQNSPEFAAKMPDPILHRTSGCLLRGDGLVRQNATTLKLGAKSNRLAFAVQVLSCCTPTLGEWFQKIDRPVTSDWAAHKQWWADFWSRSHIIVGKCGDDPIDLDQGRFSQFPQASLAYRGHNLIEPRRNAFQLTQRYALERFAEACAGRAVVPPPYNGSIFTMDMPAGAQGFSGPKGKATLADSRDWGSLSFMWQNTRHPYWAMAARGDYDTLLPGMQFVRDGLDVCRDRCRNIFHHDGAYIMEASWWHNVGVFNPGRVPGHLRYHFLATIELPCIMCEYYEHTQDRKFLEQILLPCADEFIQFYELQFPKRDDHGKMIMEPAGTVETYQPVTNPATEISGLRHLLGKLIAFDIDAPRKSHWEKLLRAIPDVPCRTMRGVRLLSPGEKYAGREICETPEMYAVYPFRQAWLGNDQLLAAARQSLHLRTLSLDGTPDSQPVETGGWQSSPVQAAYLGLPRETARLVSINFNDQFIHWTNNVDPSAGWPSRPRARFPAFWETKMDYTPDNDHGANCANALQSMLLQSDGKRIYLLPAWPEDWNVSFKLRAAFNTTVQCEYVDGKVQSLKVDPAARAADVIDMSSLENRIRTLVRVACDDRNYLFGLPPMLDGLPKPGKTTSAWLAKYGESVTNVRGGPWRNCVFRDNVVYMHILDDLAPLPRIDAKLRSGTNLTRMEEKLDAILKLEFDRPIEPIALAMASRGSLTLGRKMADGQIDLGRAATFDHIEFTIDNPGYRYGHARKFELQTKQADGTWKTVYAGAVYGCMFCKTIDPVTAQFVRLKIDAPTIRQFDLFDSTAQSRE